MTSSLPIEANRARWDELVDIHAASTFYDVKGFRGGKSSLRPIERQELGEVSGKSLLHLQCHFGLDSLSWARLGARVTGVDFSNRATTLATSLARELDLDARFLCSEIYDLPRVLDGTFDIVFTSYGVIGWLPDLPRWAQIIRHYLRPGGLFYMAEIHPFALMLSEEGSGPPRIQYPYFHSPEPLSWRTTGTYADRSAKVTNETCYGWIHSLGDVLTSLIGVGLRIEFFHEFPYCVCSLLSGMQQGDDGWWRLPQHPESLPFLFSLKATRPSIASLENPAPAS